MGQRRGGDITQLFTIPTRYTTSLAVEVGIAMGHGASLCDVVPSPQLRFGGIYRNVGYTFAQDDKEEESEWCAVASAGVGGINFGIEYCNRCAHADS